MWQESASAPSLTCEIEMVGVCGLEHHVLWIKQYSVLQIACELRTTADRAEVAPWGHSCERAKRDLQPKSTGTCLRVQGQSSPHPNLGSAEGPPGSDRREHRGLVLQSSWWFLERYSFLGCWMWLEGPCRQGTGVHAQHCSINGTTWHKQNTKQNQEMEVHGVQEPTVRNSVSAWRVSEPRHLIAPDRRCGVSVDSSGISHLGRD